MKPILRAVVVLALVLGTGWLGLWFFGNSRQIRIEKQNNPAAVRPEAEDGNSEYGGKTPRKTLDLLIAALEKNNLTLAEKYFSPEIRDQQSVELKKLYDAKILGDLIAALKTIKEGAAKDSSYYVFPVYDETGAVIAEVELKKNAEGFWKIWSL